MKKMMKISQTNGKHKKTTKENLWQFQVHLFSLLIDGVKIANANTDGKSNRP